MTNVLAGGAVASAAAAGGWATSSPGGGGATGSAAAGCTGGSMYSSRFVDRYFCLAIFLINSLRLTPAVPLIELVFLRSAGVSATSISGTWYSGLKT